MFRKAHITNAGEARPFSLNQERDRDSELHYFILDLYGPSLFGTSLVFGEATVLGSKHQLANSRQAKKKTASRDH